MKIELFKDAIAIIDGIPSERVCLRFWQDDVRASIGDKEQFFISKPKHIVETLRCCPGAWLALHPKMRDLGLRTKRKAEGEPQFACLSGMDALAAFFDIKAHEAENLFHPDREPTANNATDKVIWLCRALTLLSRYQEKANDTESGHQTRMRAANLMNAQYQEPVRL
jgi:hypothetical protein